jgi:NitT/TauT family transport system substrate-binding protein
MNMKTSITKIVGNLITSSEIKLTIFGTLLISFGINLFTGLRFWSEFNILFDDLILIMISIPIIYTGISILSTTEYSRIWNTEFNSWNSSQEENKKKYSIFKKEFVEKILADENQIIDRFIKVFYFSLVPLILLIIRVLFYEQIKIFMKKIIILFVSLCSMFSCSYNADTITVGYQEISLYQHVFIAQEKGYFKEEGLNVNLRSFASANQMMEAFLSNQIDVLGLTNTQVALTVEGKQSGQLKFINFLVWKEGAFPDYIVKRKDALIKAPKDLEGKTVGLHPGSAVRAFSQAVFEHYKLDVSKIRTIELRPEIMQSTMIAGNVDAVYCMDPVATTLFLSGLTDTLIANPMQYIFPAPTPISGTAISKKLAQDNSEVAEKLIRAIDRAIEYTRQPGVEEEVAGYIAKYTPIRKEQTLLMNPSVYWKNNEMEPERIQALAKKFFELGIVERKINIESMLFQPENRP